MVRPHSIIEIILSLAHIQVGQLKVCIHKVLVNAEEPAWLGGVYQLIFMI